MMCMSRAAAPRVLGSVGGGGRPSSNRLRTLMSVARRQSSRRGLMTKMSSASNLMSHQSSFSAVAAPSRPIITTPTKRPVLQHQHQQQQPWGAAAALANNYSTVLSQSKTVAISTAGISNHNNSSSSGSGSSNNKASTAFMAVTASVLGAGTFTLVTENESGPEENGPEEHDPEQEKENTRPPAQRSSDEVPTTKSKPAAMQPLASPASLRKFKRQSRKKKKKEKADGGPCILATSSAAPSTTDGGPFVLATSAGSYHSNDVVAAPSSSAPSSRRPFSARMRSTPLTSHVTTVSLSTRSNKKKRKKEHTAHPQQTPSFVSNKRSKHNHHNHQEHHPSAATAAAKDEHEPFNVKQVYDIQQVLGQGAYGRVYQAVRHTDGLPVALKALPRDTVDMNEFQREVTALQRLEQLRQKQQQQQQHSCSNGDVMVTTGQQHVVQMHDVHADEQNYYLALELIQPAGGCELLEHLIHHGPFSEAQAASFLRQLAEGLCFVHAANLTHADLKPENVLLSIPSPLAADAHHHTTGKCGTRRGSKLVLVDFGCSVLQQDNDSNENMADMDVKTRDILDSLQITDNQKEQRYGDGNDWEQSLGTSAYWSPELAADQGLHPTTASDMWAAGCIVYILLTGTHPFDKYGNATDEEILRLLGLVQRTTVSIGADGGGAQGYNKETLQSNLLMDELVFDERVQNLSESCVHLIKSLMHPDPTQRMTSDDFRRHAWVQGLTASWNTLQDSHTKLEAFWQRRFRAEILLKFSCMFADKNNNNNAATSAAGHHRHQELSDENLQKVFHSLDLDGNGLLDLEEIMVTFRDLGFQDTKDIRQLFESADLDGSGEIDWDEFRMVMHKQFHQGPGLLREKYRQARFRSDVLKKFQGAGTYNNNKSAKSSLSDNGTRLREMFDAMDLDSNGILDAHEIRVVLRSIGEDNEEIISRIVAAVDLNHDGGVSWDEFQEIMNATTN